MSDERNVIEVLSGELRLLAEPILVAGDAAGLERLLARLGWRLDELAGVDVSTTIAAAEQLVDAVEAAAAKPLRDLADVLAAASELGSALGAVDDICKALTEVAAPDLDADVATRRELLSNVVDEIA